MHLHLPLPPLLCSLAQNSHCLVTLGVHLVGAQGWGKTVGYQNASPVHTPPHAPALSCKPGSLTHRSKSLARPTFPKSSPCPSRWVCLPPRRPLARHPRPGILPGSLPYVPRFRMSQLSPHRAYTRMKERASWSGHSERTEWKYHPRRSCARSISPRENQARFPHPGLTDISRSPSSIPPSKA
jgi:hypothetical protein